MKWTIRISNFFILLLIPMAVSAQKVPEDNYIRGLVLFNLGDYDSAIVYFNRSQEINKNNENLFYYRGLSYFENNEPELAISDFETVEKTSRGKSSIWIARSYAKMNNINECLKFIQLNLETKYRLPESQLMLDPILTVFEKDPLWIEFWKNNYYSKLDALIAEAEYLMKNKEYIEAINLISDGLKGGLRKPPLYQKRAEVYIAMNNDKLALNDLNMAIESDRRNSSLYILRADVNLRLERYKYALEDYDAVLKTEPDMLKVYPMRAFAYSKTGMYDKAVEDMDYYLSYVKDDADAWYRYGTINSNEGKYFKALECYNKCLSLDQKDARYFLARGVTYMNTRTYNYARNDLSMALDLDPKNAEAFYQKAHACLKLGLNEEACFCFQQAYRYGKYEAGEYSEKYCIK